MPKKSSLTVEQILTLLQAAPSHIATLTADLTPSQLQATPAPDEWSATDLLAHLRACADMWGGAILHIIQEDHPTFTAQNPVSWIKKTNYRTLPFAESFKAYQAQRQDLCAALQALSEKEWARTATVTVWNTTYERSIFFYGQWLARHERTHLKQFAQIANVMR